jgi:hypothetical protein
MIKFTLKRWRTYKSTNEFTIPLKLTQILIESNVADMCEHGCEENI